MEINLFDDELEYKKFPVINKVVRLVYNILNNPNSRVYLSMDSDTDGVLCVKILSRMFDMLGYDRYTIPQLKYKSHKLETYQIYDILEGGYTHLILTDAHSNEIETLCNYFGKMPILIIDHHEVNNIGQEIPDNVILINNTLDSVNGFYEDSSAGALCASVAHQVLEELGVVENELKFYGYIANYADSVNLSKEFNRRLILNCLKDSDNAPELLKHFQDKYLNICSYLVNYRIVNRINALIRSEVFSVLNDWIFYGEMDDGELDSFLDLSRQYCNSLVSLSKVEDMGNVVIAETMAQDNTLASNYTGIVANIIAEKYGKPCICYIVTDIIKGSFRDLLGRDYLSEFKEFIDADGHTSAFGFQLPIHRKKELFEAIRGVSGREIKNKPRIIKIKDYYRDFSLVINRVALYNEFASPGVPRTLFIKNVDRSIKSDEFNPKKYYYGKKNIMVFKDELMPGDKLVINCIHNGSSEPKLYGSREVV